MSRPLEPTASAFRALACLAGAFALVLGAAMALRPAGLSAWHWAMALGLCAALLGRMARLEGWWLALLLLFAPACLAAARLDWPRWAWGVAFGALLLVYGATFRTRVPLYLTGGKTRAALLQLLPAAGTPFRCIDLGSGLGGLALHLARARPEGRFAGVELAPLPVLVAWLRLRAARLSGAGLPNLHLARASLWDQPLGNYDVAYAFLSPVPMPALWQKARREMRPGTLFISNTFAVPGVAPDRVVEVDDLRRTRLYVYAMRVAISPACPAGA